MKFLSTCFVFLLFTNVLFAQINNLHTYKTSITKDDIVADIDYYKELIHLSHVDPYQNVSKKAFHEAIADLKAHAELYNVDELLVNWLKVNALLKDEHTTIGYNRLTSKIYPFFTAVFEEGVFIIVTDSLQSKYLGKKVIALNGLPVAEVMERMKAICGNQNAAAMKENFCKYLSDPFILHGLGLIPERNQAVFTLTDEIGADTIIYQPTLSEKDKLTMQPLFDRNMLGRSATSAVNSFQYSKGNSYLYFKYHKCMDIGSQTVEDVTNAIRKVIEEQHPPKLVIDMRDNGGGNSRLLMPFIKYLKSSYLNEKGRLYVLIGRHTFSSAILNTQAIKAATYAITVGEATSGNATHFGEVRTYTLPKTHIIVGYSTKVFHTDKDNDGSVNPDVVLPVTFANYKNLKDEALEYVEAQGVK